MREQDQKFQRRLDKLEITVEKLLNILKHKNFLDDIEYQDLYYKLFD